MSSKGTAASKAKLAAVKAETVKLTSDLKKS